MWLQLIGEFNGQTKQNEELHNSFMTKIDHADNRWRLISTLSIISEKVHNTFMYVVYKHIFLQMIVNNSAAKLTLNIFIVWLQD